MAPRGYSLPERRLAAFTHMEDYIQTFLLRWANANEPLPTLTKALEEIGTMRMRLYAEREDGAPKIRPMRTKVK